jgi:hypothetical protein
MAANPDTCSWLNLRLSHFSFQRQLCSSPVRLRRGGSYPGPLSRR